MATGRSWPGEEWRRGCSTDQAASFLRAFKVCGGRGFELAVGRSGEAGLPRQAVSCNFEQHSWTWLQRLLKIVLERRQWTHATCSALKLKALSIAERGDSPAMTCFCGISRIFGRSDKGWKRLELDHEMEVAWILEVEGYRCQNCVMRGAGKHFQFAACTPYLHGYSLPQQ